MTNNAVDAPSSTGKAAPACWAPVALFVYNRPWHVRQVIEALRKNEGSEHTDLVVFSDAPARQDAEAAVREVRDLIKSIQGFRSVRVVVREKNLGLAASIIDGVTQLCDAFGKVIVLEDDLLTSPYFLRYMNDALIMYADEPRVASIHGYQYPVKEPLPQTFFLRGADCWGWATWSRAWMQFEADGAQLLERLKSLKLTRSFDLDGAYGYTGMLEDQVAGRNNSWAIRWHASCYLKGMLTLYPGESLVDNIGNDASGTHCGETRQFSVQLLAHPVHLEKITIREHADARKIVADFLRPSHVARGLGVVRSTIRRLRELV